LLKRLEKLGRVGATTSELAAASGLRPQQAAIALVALAEIGRVRPAFHNGRRVWLYGGADKRSSVRSPLQTQYTVPQAAAVTGLSEKALRRRIQRRTIKVERVGRWVFVSHAALQDAGVVDGRTKKTDLAFKTRLINDILRRGARETLSTWQISSQAGLARQATEVVLAAFVATGVVERVVAGGVAWRWVGA
jgi:hypothetical protein